MIPRFIAAAASGSRPLAVRPLSFRLLSTSHAPSMSKIKKVFPSADAAVKDIKAGSVIVAGGFGLCGSPHTLFSALAKRPEKNNLTVVGQNAGNGEESIGELLAHDMVSSLVTSHIGGNDFIIKKYLDGDVSLHLTPLGTIIERVSAGASGVPAFYTPTGYGTLVHKGGLPVRYSKEKKGEVLEVSKPREEREFNGKKYILEESINADVGFIHAWKADEAGNCIFRYTANNLSAPFGRNAKMTIVEADEIVPTGLLDPNQIHLPSVFVSRVVKATVPPMIENLVLDHGPESEHKKTPADLRREKIARRAAKEFSDGDTVNLGIGVPTLAASFIPENVNITLQAENGMLGMGPPPTEPMLHHDLVHASKQTGTILPGGAFFDAGVSFGMIRAGRMDVTMLGALQVGANGDLANYMIPGSVVKGMGGAMDLVASPDQTRVIALTDHCDKHGNPKIVENVKVPLTGVRAVSRIITELAVFDVDRISPQGGLTLVELLDGVTLEEVQMKTGAPFKVGLK